MPRRTSALLIGALAGILLALSIPKASLPLLAWVALIPLLAGRYRGRHAWLAGLACGLPASTARVYWIVETLHLFGHLPTWLATATTALLVCYLSLYYGLFVWTCGRIPFSSRFFAPLAASVWILLEWVQTWMISGFPWEFLGMSQYLNLPLVQVASVTGAYGLSFLIVLFSAGSAQFLFLPRRRPAFLFLPLGLILTVWLWGHDRLERLEAAPSVDHLDVGVIQGSIRQGEKWKRPRLGQTTAHYAELTRALADKNPELDLIIFPETAMPFAFNRAHYDAYSGDIRALAAETGIPLLVGSLYSLPDTLFNRAFLLDKRGETIDFADKVHLVPFGEYLPFPSIFGYMETLTAESGVFTHGVENRPIRLNGLPFGVFICYESIFPGIARQLTRAGAQFLVNTTNDAWFGLTAAPYQHFSMSVMRAVENGRYVVRAANTGISGLISAGGRILHTTPLFEEKTFAVRVPLRQRQTFYTRYGDAFLVLCTFVLAMAWARRLHRRRLYIRQETQRAKAQLAHFAADPKPLHRPLVLLHGYNSAPQTWEHLNTALQSCFTNTASHLHIPALEANVAPDNQAAALGPQLPSAPYDIIGHSLGALVGIELATRHPPLVSRLFALAPPLNGTRWASWGYLARLPYGNALASMRPGSAYIRTLASKIAGLGQSLLIWCMAGDVFSPLASPYRRYAPTPFSGLRRRHSLAHSDPRVLRDLVVRLRCSQ